MKLQSARKLWETGWSTNVYRMNVCRGAGVWSRADIIINIARGSLFVSPEKKSAFEGEYYWVCNTCGKEFSTKETAVIHEKNECEGLNDAKTSASKHRKEEEPWKCSICGEKLESRKGAVYHEKYVCEVLKDRRSVLSKDEKLIGEEVARRKEEREKSEQQIAEEGDELDSFTYKSRESSKRFPTNTTLIGVYRFLAYLAVGAGIVIGLLLLGDGGGVAALGIILAGVAIGINMLLVSEMIKFLMDFHDANYINTKVRIKTLEALQDISKKLKK